MTHFLRIGRETLVDCDVLKDDFRVSVLLRPYTVMLLDIEARNTEKLGEFVDDMESIQDLRQEWWENVERRPRSSDINWSEINLFLQTRLTKMAEKWNLQYVVD